MKRGFTLVETTVALGIFAILVTIASAGYIRAVRTQRQVTALIAANSNVSLMIEQMAREIRTSFGFSLNGSNLVFINANGNEVEYRFNNNAVERREETSGFIPVSADNVTVTNLGFITSGKDFGDPTFPTRIVILLSVAPKESTLQGGILHLQTTISPRFQ